MVAIETTGSDPWRHELVCVGIGGNVHEPDKGRSLPVETQEGQGGDGA